jgi:glycosyltransferase domain-containing protein
VTPRLTIVMPLKGRNLFTFRFLWHANKKRLPYRFLLADGQVHDAVAQRLEDSRKFFPELDIEYVRYPDDSDYSRFFTKLSDAMRRVRTPYAMLADNDDFLGFDGIEKALDFLDARADYVCARGHQMGFSLYSGIGAVAGSISGKFNQFYLDPDHKEFDASSAAQRLQQGGLCHRLHYAIWRTAAPLCIMTEIADINFSDLMLYEDFFALRALTLGKAHLSNEAISYYSQAGTGVSYTPTRDWESHLRQKQFTSGADAIVERISAATVAADGVDAAKVAADVRAILENYYQSILKANGRVTARVKRALRDQWPKLAIYMQALPRPGAALEREAMVSQLKNAGATEQGLGCIRQELAEIESAMSREALADFAGPFLPMAQSCNSRVWV